MVVSAGSSDVEWDSLGTVIKNLKIKYVIFRGPGHELPYSGKWGKITVLAGFRHIEYLKKLLRWFLRAR